MTTVVVPAEVIKVAVVKVVMAEAAAVIKVAVVKVVMSVIIISNSRKWQDMG
jgi:hypothetical protein